MTVINAIFRFADSLFVTVFLIIHNTGVLEHLKFKLTESNCHTTKTTQ